VRVAIGYPREFLLDPGIVCRLPNTVTRGRSSALRGPLGCLLSLISSSRRAAKLAETSCRIPSDVRSHRAGVTRSTGGLRRSLAGLEPFVSSETMQKGCLSFNKVQRPSFWNMVGTIPLPRPRRRRTDRGRKVAAAPPRGHYQHVGQVGRCPMSRRWLTAISHWALTACQMDRRTRVFIPTRSARRSKNRLVRLQGGGLRATSPPRRRCRTRPLGRRACRTTAGDGFGLAPGECCTGRTVSLVD
jgi:hypothetical protein